MWEGRATVRDWLVKEAMHERQARKTGAVNDFRQILSPPVSTH